LQGHALDHRLVVLRKALGVGLHRQVAYVYAVLQSLCDDALVSRAVNLVGVKMRGRAKYRTVLYV
jgi:hypothetical protein